MTRFSGELGLQFVTHLANHYTVPQFVRLAQFAADKGFEQIWFNDNVRYRSQLVVMTAIAARVPIRLGTAVLVPYFHNPIDVADGLAALSELCPGKELDIGIARGDLAQSPQHITTYKPIAMVREWADFLRCVLNGGKAPYARFPVMCEYYRLNPKGALELAFKPQADFKFYGGGNGPQSLRMCGQTMDGLISSGTFIPMLKSGRLPGMLAVAEKAAQDSGGNKSLRKVVELNVSIANNRDRALAFPKRQVAHSILQWEALGFTDGEYKKMGVERASVLKLREAFNRGATIEEAATLVTEQMVRCYYAAGTAEEVRDQIVELVGAAQQLGYAQVAFAKLGPDYDDAIELLAREVVPRLS